MHRDIKSANILLSIKDNKDICMIADFGLTKVIEQTLANANTIVGTLIYMSPEIINGIPYTIKTDIWSLGCILYELCTLKYPFYN